MHDHDAHNCPAYIIDVESGCYMIAVSCRKCREVALYETVKGATDGAVYHATSCHTTDISIIEVLSA